VRALNLLDFYVVLLLNYLLDLFERPGRHVFVSLMLAEMVFFVVVESCDFNFRFFDLIFGALDHDDFLSDVNNCGPVGF
jgi:hypothetical protein